MEILTEMGDARDANVLEKQLIKFKGRASYQNLKIVKKITARYKREREHDDEAALAKEFN